MIPLGSTLPHDTASLRAGLAQGAKLLGKDAAAISLKGEFPQLEALDLELSGARLDRNLRLPAITEPGTQLCFARAVSVRAQPATFEGIPFTLAIEAEDVVFAGARGAKGEAILRLDRAGRGAVDFSITRTDLEAAVLAAAQEAAKKQGADVKSVRLEMSNHGPRSLSLRAEVTAKAMFVTAKVTVSGKVEINDALEARLQGLDCVGEGMVGKLAASALRPKFAALEGRPFPLGQMVAGLSLREITLQGGESLRLQAKFGGA